MLISLACQNFENNDYDLNVMFSIPGDSIGNKYQYINYINVILSTQNNTSAIRK